MKKVVLYFHHNGMCEWWEWMRGCTKERFTWNSVMKYCSHHGLIWMMIIKSTYYNTVAFEILWNTLFHLCNITLCLCLINGPYTDFEGFHFKMRFPSFDKFDINAPNKTAGINGWLIPMLNVVPFFHWLFLKERRFGGLIHLWHKQFDMFQSETFSLSLYWTGKCASVTTKWGFTSLPSTEKCLFAASIHSFFNSPSLILFSFGIKSKNFHHP